MTARRAPKDRGSDLPERVLAVIRQIPRGRVASYGLVAALAGAPGAARQVGRILFALPDGSRVPWHRVVNAQGAISSHPARCGSDEAQRLLLERERVRFDDAGRVDLTRHAWKVSP